MSPQESKASFEQVCPLPEGSATLIEGLPGHGLVASIAVDQITAQLDLNLCGNIASDAFPPVVTFEDGVVQDLVRVYGGTEPTVLTLESDLALPYDAFEPLANCVLEDLSPTFERAIFLAGAPAESEEQVGEVTGIATTEALVSDLKAAGITVDTDLGVVGGITGALVRECYQADVPAVLLIVRAHPFLPDPSAAKSVIENALEPLVEFEIDTTELDKQADDIQQRMHQIAAQYQQMMEGESQQDQQQVPGMFQ